MHAGPPGDDDTQRITLVIAFWHESLMPAEGQPGSGPARPPPWRQQCVTQLEEPPHPRADDTAGSFDTKAHAYNWWAPAHANQTPRSAADIAGLLAGCRHRTVSAQPAVTPQLVKQVAFICPVWLTLEKALTAKRKRQRTHAGGDHCLCAPLPPLMFFLRSADDIHKIYNYG